MVSIDSRRDINAAGDLNAEVAEDAEEEEEAEKLFQIVINKIRRFSSTISPSSSATSAFR